MGKKIILLVEFIFYIVAYWGKVMALTFQYFKNKISPKDIFFLQDTHFSKVTEKIWSDEFNGDLIFSHGKTNSCGVLVGFYGNINYSVKKKLSDNSGRLLALDVTINGTEYLLNQNS